MKRCLKVEQYYDEGLDKWITVASEETKKTTQFCHPKRCEHWATSKCFNCKHATDLRDNYERRGE